MKLFSILGGKNTKQSDNVHTTAYTKEFPYLPTYHWVQATEFTPATTEEPFGEAKYIIHNTRDVEVYKVYKNILIKDGWTITQELEVTSFSAEKGSHLANILIWIWDEGNVLLTVRSK